MLRLLVDQNFNHKILRGLMDRVPQLDVVTTQEVGLSRMSDPELLTWAAAEGCILVTHDLQTIPDFASDSIHAGQPMPGVFVVPRHLPIGQVIED
ncbi:MAG: DUF5615 family PIN-like protein, partial [Acidiferrobacterales bacterium]